MDNLFYVRFTLSTSEALANLPASTTSLSTLVTRIHRAARGRRFALSFPELMDGDNEAIPTLGNVLQVFFSCREDAQHLLDADQVRRIVQDMFVATPIRPVVPNMIVGWERFMRDRRNDKLAPSARRRAERRLASGVTKSSVRDKSSIHIDTDAKCNLPFFDHLSINTANPGEEARHMRIYVRRASSSKPASFDFDSFGLSRPKSNMASTLHGAVPILRNSMRVLHANPE